MSNSLNSEVVLEIKAGKIIDTQQSKTIDIRKSQILHNLVVMILYIKLLFELDNF